MPIPSKRFPPASPRSSTTCIFEGGELAVCALCPATRSKVRSETRNGFILRAILIICGQIFFLECISSLLNLCLAQRAHQRRWLCQRHHHTSHAAKLDL